MNGDKMKKTLADFRFYKANRDSLMRNPAYYGKYVVIKDRAVVRAFGDEDAAIDYMDAQGVPMGNYIVQAVREDDGTLVQMGSQVIG